MNVDGAPENENLEHFDPDDVLEKLEEWERYLQSDPDLALALRLLDQKPADEDTSKSNAEQDALPSKASTARSRGPRP